MACKAPHKLNSHLSSLMSYGCPMSSHSRGSLQIQEHESLILPSALNAPFPDTCTAHTCITFQHAQMSYSRACCPNHFNLYWHSASSLLHFFSNSPDCLLIYCTICTYFLLIAYSVFHPQEDELQEGRIFFFCFFVFLVPRHCLTITGTPLCTEWMNG